MFSVIATTDLSRDYQHQPVCLSWYKSPLHRQGRVRYGLPGNWKNVFREDNPGENPTFTPGTPWSQYSDEEVKANAGSGKPLPKQYYQGKKVNPNINDAWQTNEQAQATEDLENTNN